MELALSADADGIITVRNPKQRDLAPFDPLKVRRCVVDLGDEGTSCVLEAVEGTVEPAPANGLSARASAALAALPPEGATFEQWRELASSVRDDLPAGARGVGFPGLRH